MLAVVPAVARERPHMQIFLMAIISACVNIATCINMPWRVSWLNYFDIMIFLIFELVLLVGAAAVPADEHDTLKALATILALVLCAVVPVFVIPLARDVVSGLQRPVQRCMTVNPSIELRKLWKQTRLVHCTMTRETETQLAETQRNAKMAVKGTSIAQTKKCGDSETYVTADAAERVHFETTVSKQLPPGPRICICGGTKFQNPESEILVRMLAHEFTSRLQGRAVVLTGGMPGVQKTFVEGTAGALGASLIHLLPEGASSNFDFGVDITAGEDLPRRIEVFSRIGHAYLTVEGGPGVAKEANTAFERGAVVLPMICTGGASSGMFDFPPGALQRPDGITEEQWSSLGNKGSPEIVAKTVVDILVEFIELWDDGSDQVASRTFRSFEWRDLEHQVREAVADGSIRMEGVVKLFQEYIRNPTSSETLAQASAEPLPLETIQYSI